MQVEINNVPYDVVIVRKSNKNLYIRVKEDLKIYVTCNIFVSEHKIRDLILTNENSIIKMIDRQKKKIEKKNKFYLLGKSYNIVICNTCNKPEIIEDKVYTKNLDSLEHIYKDYIEKVFSERFDLCFKKFEGRIPYPKLRIRKMRQKWGHCNKNECTVTLNSELIKYDIDEIDYVIIHEMCHLIHFNHSKEFWFEVECYKPDFKKNRKILREE